VAVTVVVALALAAVTVAVAAVTDPMIERRDFERVGRSPGVQYCPVRNLRKASKETSFRPSAVHDQISMDMMDIIDMDLPSSERGNSKRTKNSRQTDLL